MKGGVSLVIVTETLLAPTSRNNDGVRMRQILEIEDHVTIPPMMYSDPFYRITYLIKEEIRKYKWTEGEKGRCLSWPEARAEWTEAHHAEYERFLLETLAFPKLVPAEGSERQTTAKRGHGENWAGLSTLPHRSSA
jgi:hypothetical protein